MLVHIINRPTGTHIQYSLPVVTQEAECHDEEAYDNYYGAVLIQLESQQKQQQHPLNEMSIK